MNQSDIGSAVNAYMKSKWKSEEGLKTILKELLKAKKHELLNCEIMKEARGRG